MMFRQPPLDCIPAGLHWEPSQLDVEAAQQKRRTTNQKASNRRRTKSPDLQVDDLVVVKDQHPGGKVTTRRGERQVTQNISCFKRVEVSHEDSGDDASDKDEKGGDEIMAQEEVGDWQSHGSAPVPVTGDVGHRGDSRPE
ncbi:hypothetical protein NDU88_001332 [Pleurodeles waltl]|uniref:Uncharacterized protein n=1 Tax=Pleurodeles waltl TaxID=8319 RepID=A0AAV7NFE8_PLEWA|nr:hypothetical protein NDU88_001332 [Pleurodeles waltl]